MSTPERLRADIASIVADHTGWPARSIADETSFFDEMGFDNLDLLDMLLDVEKRFGVDIADDDREAIATFGELVKCVERKRELAVVS